MDWIAELEAMQLALRLVPGPDDDKDAAINAIMVLIETK